MSQFTVPGPRTEAEVKRWRTPAAGAHVVEQTAAAARLGRHAHPLEVLAALRRAEAERAAPEVRAELTRAFERAFAALRPTGRREVITLDVSASMAWGRVGGVPGLTPRDAAVALALAAVVTDPETVLLGFFAGRDGWRPRFRADGVTPLAITPGTALPEALAGVAALPFTATDPALPIRYAHTHELAVDRFVVFTDGATWTGDLGARRALDAYRAAGGRDAQLELVGLRNARLDRLVHRN